VVGLLGKGISPVVRLLLTQGNADTDEMQTDVHVSTGILSLHPSI
jgi:hypothetical protein